MAPMRVSFPVVVLVLTLSVPLLKCDTDTDTPVYPQTNNSQHLHIIPLKETDTLQQNAPNEVIFGTYREVYGGMRTNEDAETRRLKQRTPTARQRLVIVYSENADVPVDVDGETLETAHVPVRAENEENNTHSTHNRMLKKKRTNAMSRLRAKRFKSKFLKNLNMEVFFLNKKRKMSANLNRGLSDYNSDDVSSETNTDTEEQYEDVEEIELQDMDDIVDEIDMLDDDVFDIAYDEEVSIRHVPGEDDNKKNTHPSFRGQQSFKKNDNLRKLQFTVPDKLKDMRNDPKLEEQWYIYDTDLEINTTPRYDLELIDAWDMYKPAYKDRDTVVGGRLMHTC